MGFRRQGHLPALLPDQRHQGAQGFGLIVDQQDMGLIKGLDGGGTHGSDGCDAPERQGTRAVVGRVKM
jgi:hypothetical protein